MIKMKLWSYYLRRETNKEPEMLVRCVGVFKDAYVISKPNGGTLYIPKNEYALEPYGLPLILENK